jgi:cytochrome oxidase Cu insertion factor (SCO1/SenC/PrrC family)
MNAALIAFFFVAIGLASQKPPERTVPEIGIAVGQQMPHFVAPDQSGKEISSDTLKGPKGTMLLFFRSADW